MNDFEGDIDSARKELDALIHGQGDDDAEQRLESVRRIVDKYPALCKEKGYCDELPLHEAVEFEASFDILECLVTCYPEALVAQDVVGFTPLHRYSADSACDGVFQLAVFELLISTEAAHTRDMHGMFPLHHYCQGTHVLDLQVVRLLVEAHPESVKEVNDAGNTPLHYAVFFRGEADIPAIQYLIQRYPEAVTVNNYNGLMPLHKVCCYASINSLPVIRFLIEEYPTTASMIDDDGRTPLSKLAGNAGSDVLPIACLLAEAHPESVTMLDSGGRTPLHHACEVPDNHHLLLVPFLVERPA